MDEQLRGDIVFIKLNFVLRLSVDGLKTNNSALPRSISSEKKSLRRFSIFYEFCTAVV